MPTLSTADAFDQLTANHRGQHRCTDGIYYGPKDSASDWARCPVNHAASTLADAIVTAHTAPHEAVHDPDVITQVAGAMLSGPLDELDPEQQEAWRMLARLGLEEFCQILDTRRAELALVTT